MDQQKALTTAEQFATNEQLFCMQGGLLGGILAATATNSLEAITVAK